MLSMELIRAEPDMVRRAIESRGQSAPVDEILELDQQRRTAIADADQLRARRNRVSRELGKAKERSPELIEEMRGVGAQIRELEERIRADEELIEQHLLVIPNIPRADAPVGPDEASNVVERTEGEIPGFDFEPLPHWELGPSLGIIDFERGARLSGSRFYILQGKGARLQRALTDWMLDLHVDQHRYREMYLPFIINRETATASGHLPHFVDEMYHDDEDDLWLLPTAEAAINSIHRDEIIEPGQLPLRYVAHTPCWRREKFSAGRDTRGIKRVHQFEKVEMFKFVEPDTSDDELDKLVADAEDVTSKLEIPYRVIQLCTGDMSAPAVRTYDIEMWAPGGQEWLEVSSCSNCTDYQARRAMIRYRPEAGARPRLLHTLNGSGLALPRVIIAILENYQQADGSVIVPEVLRPYTGFDRIEAP